MTEWGVQVQQVIEEMRTIARVAGQCSVEGPQDEKALMAAAEADRASRWADRLAALVAASVPPPDKCMIGEYCRTHGFIHGAEAEELRAHLEAFIQERPDARVRDLQAVLDDVDARDSAAYLEAEVVPVAASVPPPPPEEEEDQYDHNAVNSARGMGMSEVRDRECSMDADVHLSAQNQATALFVALPEPSVVATVGPVVLRIEVEREEDGRFFASYTREFSAAHPNGREGGAAEYSATPIGAVANLLAVLIKVDEDNAKEAALAALPVPSGETEPKS